MPTLNFAVPSLVYDADRTAKGGELLAKERRMLRTNS